MLKIWQQLVKDEFNLTFEKMLFKNFNNSRKADSKFNIEYAIVQLVVFKHFQEEPTDALYMLNVFIRFLCHGQGQRKSTEGHSRSPLSAPQDNL